MMLITILHLRFPSLMIFALFSGFTCGLDSLVRPLPISLTHPEASRSHPPPIYTFFESPADRGRPFRNRSDKS
ncbi:hypothetical protein DFP73DRAFT_566706 [Morchella snyderi]|nr:hypothetical protein DFP73DRAFT_566706 [Morchella snyderi]